MCGSVAAVAVSRILVTTTVGCSQPEGTKRVVSSVAV